MDLDGWQLLQGRFYDMGTSNNKSYSLGSVFGARPIGTDEEEIYDQVHALNKSVQR